MAHHLVLPGEHVAEAGASRGRPRPSPRHGEAPPRRAPARHDRRGRARSACRSRYRAGSWLVIMIRFRSVRCFELKQLEQGSSDIGLRLALACRTGIDRMAPMSKDREAACRMMAPGGLDPRSCWLAAIRASRKARAMVRAGLSLYRRDAGSWEARGGRAPRPADRARGAWRAQRRSNGTRPSMGSATRLVPEHPLLCALCEACLLPWALLDRSAGASRQAEVRSISTRPIRSTRRS